LAEWAVLTHLTTLAVTRSTRAQTRSLSFSRQR
jgi:hypothetical protein